MQGYLRFRGQLPRAAAPLRGHGGLECIHPRLCVWALCALCALCAAAQVFSSPVLLCFQLAQAMAPECAYVHSEHVRTAALCCLHRLFKIGLDDPVDTGHGQAVLGYIFKDLMQSFLKERSFPVVCTAAEAFSEVMRLCVESHDPPRAGVPVEFLPEVFTCVKVIFEKSFERRTKTATEMQK